MCLVIRRNGQDMVKNVPNSSYKVPPILVKLSLNLDMLNRFSKNLQISNFIKILPVGAELFHADGRTETTNLIVAFWNFVISKRNSMFRHTVVLSVLCASENKQRLFPYTASTGWFL
jgi:hypothetical protein